MLSDPPDNSNDVDNRNFLELREYFTCNNDSNQNKTYLYVQLTDSGIKMICATQNNTLDAENTNEQHLQYADIVGMRCSKQLHCDGQATLSACMQQTPRSNNFHNLNGSVYLYIYAYVKHLQPLRRQRIVHILHFSNAGNQQQNNQVAQMWQSAIIHNKQLKLGGDWPKCLPLLILLNPKAGAGKSRDYFNNYMLPVLHETSVPFELQITTSANYARELVRMRNDLLDQYSGIVIASGDGLFFEVLNGIMSRSDGKLISSKLPLGIVPCGSGNGLARSIAHWYNEPYDPKPVFHAMLHCASGQTASMDIVRVQLGNGEVMYSFLSIGWGFIADIDIESEALRSLGSHRFTLWTIHRLINLRTYKGRITYLPHNIDLYYDAIDVEPNDNSYTKQLNWNAQSSVFSYLNDNGNKNNDGWICEEGEYVMVHAAYTTHISADALFSPKSRINDGIIYLVIIRAGISRKELLNCISRLNNGNHLPKQPHRFIHVKPVTAFRLEPLETDGILVVDGERIPYGPIQAEILPGAIKVMVPNTDR